MDYLITVVSLICVYAVLASSLNIVMGYGGLFSVAHAAFYGIGAYAFTLITIRFGVPFVPALLVAFIAAAVASTIISVPSLRISAEYLMLATFAVQILASSLFLNLDITGGPAGIRNIPGASFFGFAPHDRAGTMLGFIATALFCCYVMFEMGRSPFGRVLKAIREDEFATASLGKNITGFKIAAFAAGCGFAGVAGGMYASLISFINPDSFQIYMSFTIVVMVLLGGLANPLGGFVGAVALTLLQEFLRVMLPSAIGAHVSQIVLGVILVVVVLKRPQGLMAEHTTVSGNADDVLSNRGGAASRDLSQEAAAFVTAPANDDGPLLDIRGVVKSYGGVHAVRDVSLTVAKGEIVGLVGANGAGKTTVFDMVAGAVKPDAGSIHLYGRDVTGLPIYRLGRQGIGRLFQDARPLANMTVIDNVMVGFRHLRREQPMLSWLPIDRAHELALRARARSYLEFMGLGALAQERAGNLSFGQQKLLGFARLMSQEARLWLLDEPAAGVDPAMREEIKVIIARCRKELGITVLVVEHNMDFLKGLADRVVFMAEGKILSEGTLDEIASNRELNRRYLGA